MTRWWNLLVLGSLCWAAAAVAGPPFGGPEPRIAQMLERHADEIGLDDATLAQIRAVVADAKDEEQRLHRAIREARHGLRDLLDAESPDEAAVMRQAEVLGALETEALKQRLQTLLAVHPLLSDEQLAKLRTLREHRFASVRDACREDVLRFCDEDGTHGRSLLKCLRRHRDELSEECRDALRDSFAAKHR